MNAQNGRAEKWLENFTKQLRVKLPKGQYIVTHARASLQTRARSYSSAY